MSRRDEIIKEKLEEILEDFGCFIPDGPPNPQQAAICASLVSLVKGYGKECFDAALEEIWNFVNDSKENSTEEKGEIIEIGKLCFFIDELSGDE